MSLQTAAGLRGECSCPTLQTEIEPLAPRATTQQQMSTNNTIGQTLVEASLATRVGEQEEARRLYEEIIRQAPDRVEAWLGLAGLVNHPDDKRACFELALRCAPGNREAVAGIEFLRRRSQIPLKREADRVEPARDTALAALIASVGPLDAPPSAVAAPAEDERLFCTNHPQVETMLRCNKCNRPMCVRCVRLTDVGYRCKTCISGQQAVYFNAESLDYPIAFGVGFIVCAIASPLTGLFLARLGYFGLWISFLAGSAAGGILAELIRRAIQRRRGRYLWAVAFGGILAGVLVGNVALWIMTGIFPLLSLLNLIFTGLALSAAYARLR